MNVVRVEIEDKSFGNHTALFKDVDDAETVKKFLELLKMYRLLQPNCNIVIDYDEDD